MTEFAAPYVLVVEDDPALCDVLESLFAGEGFQVQCVNDGLAALDAVAREQPDVIVTDVAMPRLDGLGLMRRLREQGARIPIVLISATNVDPGEPDVRFLAKPFDIDHLLNAVEGAMRR
jgi:two-component system response regulator MprA